MARNVILDVDTGSDDACAIILAALSPEIRLLGCVAVNGNRPVQDTLKNTLKIIELLHAEKTIPVVKGASAPLVRELLPGRSHNPKTAEIQLDENGEEIFESIDDEDELQDVYEHFSRILFDDKE